MSINFDEFGFSEQILKGVKDAGFVTPSPVQEAAIPYILDGRDILAQAHTGTGKTAAFGLPIMSELKAGEKFLVIVPTRELAIQVSDELYRLGKFAGIRTAAVYGGQSYTRQRKLIEEGVQVVTATPGRLLDHLSGGKIEFSPKYVVLDEADEMLDMGFLEDIKSIFSYLPAKRQTLLFSATLPKGVTKLAEAFLKDPVSVNVKGIEPATNSDIEEIYYVVEEYERLDAMVRLIDFYDPVKMLIFTRTKKDTEIVSTSLVAKGYPAKALNGDMPQPQREEVIKSFRKGDITLLAATDVAARGLDIADISHVLNYHIPFDSDSYVHRVGRTGRAGKKGIAVTLVTPEEYRGLTNIKRATGSDITYKKVPTLSEAHKNLETALTERVRRQDVSHFSKRIVNKLEEEMDIKAIAYRLASALWKNEGFGGPENLGVAGKKLENLHNPHPNVARHNKFGRDRKRHSAPKIGRRIFRKR
ncbi:MAG: DEAD/DEAH box helicase [Deferribacteraceae bacterium]|jgi:ATP-dependent RNA helicase DeaD|nr:DEAD/DEAH box helicase [Deferribacteraceae bacterium]